MEARGYVAEYDSGIGKRRRLRDCDGVAMGTGVVECGAGYETDTYHIYWGGRFPLYRDAKRETGTPVNVECSLYIAPPTNASPRDLPRPRI